MIRNLRASVRTRLAISIPAFWRRYVAPFADESIRRRSVDVEEVEQLPGLSCQVLRTSHFEPAATEIHCVDAENVEANREVLVRPYRASQTLLQTLITAEKVRVSLPSGTASTHGKFIVDTYPSYDVLRNPKYLLSQALHGVGRAAGTHRSGFFLYPPWSHNFYHWMIDVLPRAAIYLESELPQQGVPIVIFDGANGFVRESLSLVVPDHQILALPPGQHVFDTMWLPGRLAPYFDIPDSTRAFYQERVLPSLGPGPRSSPNPRRLYISRADAASRGIQNEEELVEVLERHGFVRVIMSDYTVAEQARLFAGAEFVIGPHGAAFSNLIYCRAGTKLIEIFKEGFINQCFYRLADRLGLTYGFHCGPSVGLGTLVEARRVEALIDELDDV
ncbi:MAG: glycosyltransferase family 61 protein [Myxococcota bacterium]